MSAIRFASRLYQRNLRFWCLVIFLSVVLMCLYSREQKHHDSFIHFRKHHWDLSHVGRKWYPVARNYTRRDWHDYSFIEYESKRKGPGEQGQPVQLTNAAEKELDKQLEITEGFHVFISDKISVNRSVPDTRPAGCKKKNYFANLPSTSVIIVCYNEWPSMLLRTIHSVYNRSPRELLKEIIVVDDASTKPELKSPLDEYVRKHFDGKVKIRRLEQREGLIVARMEGAKVATGEVLIFLDGHMEANNNWLPPLLEPIVISPTTVTTPALDSIIHQTFSYIEARVVRGVFNEILWYQWNVPTRLDVWFPDQPHQVPIMLGAAFAIRRDYFYEIGQYDDGLMIWNGEQIELSLKLHLCGGDLIEVPCSRLSHTFRSHQNNHELEGIDVAARNFKRIAEVWLDEYKQVVYESDPERFNKVDAGDITQPMIVKKKLECKPFQYFLEQIAPDMYVRYFYLLDFPGHFAWGAIRSDANPKYCIDYMYNLKQPVQLYQCNDPTLVNPEHSQKFRLTWHRTLKLHEKDDCLNENLFLVPCHHRDGLDGLKWKYDIDKRQIISLKKLDHCLTTDVKGGKIVDNGKSILNSLKLLPCNAQDDNQKFSWGFTNETALKNFNQIDYVNYTFKGFPEKFSSWKYKY